MKLLSATMLALLMCAPVQAEDAPRESSAKTIAAFRKALRSKLSDERTSAFEMLRGVRDPLVMDDIAYGIEQFKRNRATVSKEQGKAEAAYEKSITAMNDLKRKWESSRKSARDMKAFNKRERKIAQARDRALQQLHTLENDFMRNEGAIQAGTAVAAHIMSELDEADAKVAVERLTLRWLDSPDMTDRARFVHAVWGVEKPFIAEVLHKIVDNKEQSPPARVTAIIALAEREDPAVLDKAVSLLELPPDQFTLVIAAVKALRKLHRLGAIEPLMTFLKREDLGRLREDAHLALKSLTGEEHGPYFDPWNRWWEVKKSTFKMPLAPATTRDLNTAQKGSTFYGIHTFSKRILYIVDISGSMDQELTRGSGKTKMEVVRKELSNAVLSLENDAVFAVVFFNHEVMPWRSGPTKATEPVKKQLEKWLKECKPIGATNIYDAIEKGFEIAQPDKGAAALDTIYFLTDGKPTAGKFQDPERILARVRQMNSTANLKIHVIGIGKTLDENLCVSLARIGDGKFEWRGGTVKRKGDDPKSE